MRRCEDVHRAIDDSKKKWTHDQADNLKLVIMTTQYNR